MSDPVELDLSSDRVPRGRISIEASAGTGKTYSLTQLVVLHVAHGNVEADQVLLVTFTRAATAELRHKTREMCGRVLDALETGDLAGLEWVSGMFDDPEMRSAARDRLARFLSRYDEVTISTIHGFCQRILRRAGLGSVVPPGFEVTTEIDEVIDRAITDALAAPLGSDPSAFVAPADDAPPSASITGATAAGSAVSTIRKSVRKSLGNPGAVILPHRQGHPNAMPKGAASSPKRQISTDLAENIASTVTDLVDRVRKWCAEHGVVTQDDLVRLAADAVYTAGSDGDDGHPTALASEIAAQYRLVMVDEFQDTDELQWRIFKAIHDADKDDQTLVTVGDAKQAIYRFRGADVAVYVDAESTVPQRFRISTNRRSTRRLLHAFESLFMRAGTADIDDRHRGFAFDASGDVRFVPVIHDPAKDVELALDLAVDYAVDDVDVDLDVAPATRVTEAPFEIRWIARDESLSEGSDVNNTGLVQDVIDADFPNRIIELLRHGSVPGRGLGSGRRRIQPADVAVLVSSNVQADSAVDALRASGIPVVQMKTGSVTVSEAARHWRMFLGGVAHSNRPRRVRARAVSLFGRMDARSLLASTDDDMAEVQRECSEDAELLASRGITALYLKHRTRPGFLERVLARDDGERLLTDLDHVGELLAAHPLLSRNPAAIEVLSVLEEMIDEADDEDQADERKRRIETDASAVTVMTIHASKGLQFPVVVLPTIHTMAARSEKPFMFTHRFDGSRRRALDPASGFSGPGEPDKWEFAPGGVLDPVIGVRERTSNGAKSGREPLQKSEAHEERRRLLYVALTRAEFKVIAYWSRLHHNYPRTPTSKAVRFPWAELLEWSTPAFASGLKLDDDNVASTMAALSKLSGGDIATVEIGPSREDRLRWNPSSSSVGTRAVVLAHAAAGDGPLVTRGWRRWSYSGLSRLFKQGFAGPESTFGPPPGHGFDEQVLAVPPAPIDQFIDALPADEGLTALGRVRGGATLGDLVHGVMDAIDPSSTTVEDEVGSRVREGLAGWSDSLATPAITESITRGIIEVLDCPLGSGFGGETLRSLGRRHRLSEMHFDFRLVQSEPFPLRLLGEILGREQDLPVAIARHADRMADPMFDLHDVAGFMTGSIDAVLRVSDGESTRFFVVDYKTDTVHRPEDLHKGGAYESRRLDEFMADRGYIVQAMVYSVALHRFLRWRLREQYDFERHFGGAAYLFMRGMTGSIAADGEPRGVWRWRPSRQLVESLDGLFAMGGGTR